MNFREFLIESRYSVEVNYRTNIKQVSSATAKIILGYVSANLKNEYHVRQIFDEEPVRIFISARNFEDGEWIAILSFNPETRKFVISKGFYRKDTKVVRDISGQNANGNNGAELATEMRGIMVSFENKPDQHQPTLKPLNLRRGPKK